MPSKLFRTLSVLSVSALSLIASTTGANAVATTNGIELYFSAPFVQGPSYTGGDVSLETFDGFSTGSGACLGASAVGEITTTCQVGSGDSSGGASTSTDTPTFGGSASQYALTPWPSGGAEIEIIFPEGKKFIGMWWSAGNVESDPGATNYIEFYNGQSLLVTMTANQVMDLLGGTVPNPYPGTATLDTVGGGTHTIGYYYGHPATHSSITPTTKSSWTPDNPFVYLNLFTVGATEVDRVVIGGYGFEFDNFATSSLEKTPTDDMVFVTEYSDEVTPIEDVNSGGEDSVDSTTLASTGFSPLLGLSLAGSAIAFGIALLLARRATRRG